jgi:predicted nucleotidyltransferase
MGIEHALIEEIVRRVLSVAQPERIILFGSAAAGTMTPDSDIDLLVLERTPAAPREEGVRIRRALRGLDRPFDIVVMDAGWFEASKDVAGGLAYPAARYGRVIYAPQ